MAAVHKWLWVRLGIVAAAVPGGLSFASPETVKTSNVDWWACLALVFGVPVAVLFVVGIQALNPWSAPTWRKPSWTVNPFDFSQPLQSLHVTSFFFLAGGVAAFSSLPFHGWSGAPLAVSLVSIGAGSWVGVWLCVWCFRHKLVRDDT